MEVKRVRKHEETFIVCISSVCLNLHVVLLEHLPVITIFERCFDEDAIKVGREVLTANNLPNEVYLGFEVRPRSHLVTHCLQLVDLLLLHVL